MFDRLFTWVLLGFPMFHCVESVFLDFSWFYWMFTGLRHVLLGFTKLHSVVLIFIKFWLGSSRCLIRFTGFHVISWGSLNWLLLNLVRLYWNFTGFNQIFLGFSMFHWVWSRLTWVLLLFFVALGFIYDSLCWIEYYILSGVFSVVFY